LYHVNESPVSFVLFISKGPSILSYSWLMREFLHGYIICDDQLRGEVPEQREWVGGFSSEVGFSPRELYKARRVICR